MLYSHRICVPGGRPYYDLEHVKRLKFGKGGASIWIPITYRYGLPRGSPCPPLVQATLRQTKLFTRDATLHVACSDHDEAVPRAVVTSPQASNTGMREAGGAYIWIQWGLNSEQSTFHFPNHSTRGLKFGYPRYSRKWLPIKSSQRPCPPVVQSHMYVHRRTA